MQKLYCRIKESRLAYRSPVKNKIHIPSTMSTPNTTSPIIDRMEEGFKDPVLQLQALRELTRYSLYVPGQPSDKFDDFKDSKDFSDLSGILLATLQNFQDNEDIVFHAMWVLRDFVLVVQPQPL